MGINGWLVLDIALGIVVGDVLRVMVKDTQVWWNSRRTAVNRTVDEKAADESEAEDWNFLWDSVPESAKEEVRKFVADEQLRRRAQDLNLWPYLWRAAPQETKDRLRARWKASKIPPKVSE
jgi:hypothetical protein